jgi:hypothetical protein
VADSEILADGMAKAGTLATTFPTTSVGAQMEQIANVPQVAYDLLQFLGKKATF